MKLKLITKGKGFGWWFIRKDAGSPPIDPGDALLLESGDFILLESGDKLLLEA